VTATSRDWSLESFDQAALAMRCISFTFRAFYYGDFDLQRQCKKQGEGGSLFSSGVMACVFLFFLVIFQCLLCILLPICFPSPCNVIMCSFI